MIVIGVFGLCLGAALAQSFRVLALVPGAIGAIMLVTAFELSSGNDFLDTLLASGMVACALQFGYLLGLFLKSFFADQKTARMTKAWLS
jgi:hypothetical protein